MGMMTRLFWKLLVTPKGHKVSTEGIEGGHQRGQQGNPKNDAVKATMFGSAGRGSQHGQDFVFTPEP